MSLEDYLASVANALAIFLRPYRGMLHPRWLGIEREKRSFVLRRSEHGYSAELVGEWLGAPVLRTWWHSAGQRLTCTLRGLSGAANEQRHLSLGIKRLTGECNLEFTVDRAWNAAVNLNSRDSTLLVIGPECVQGLSNDEFAALHKPGYSGRPPTYAIPEWSLGIVSNLPPGEELRGLDSDPIITASGFAEAILNFEGLRGVGEPERFGTAAADLRWAASTLSATNERVLQELLERKPWILLHEAEFMEVLARPTIKFNERLSDGSTKAFSSIPDFVYHLLDDMSLVVEIESATKRLQVLDAEGSFRLPSAAAVHSMFQILNYQHHFSGALGSQARRQLGKADAWSFRYLLVVGSKLQPGFDERSWMALRDQVHRTGVDLRTWDYYIDRLERIAAMARMDNVDSSTRPT